MQFSNNGTREYRDSPERVALLHSTGLMDGAPTPALDRWTRLGTQLLGVPVSLLSLVDQDRQYFAGQTGLDEPWATRRETPLTHSFCQHVVEARAPFVVRDATQDPRVEGNQAISDFGVVGYLGVPVMAHGHVLGALCAITHTPRDWAHDDLEALATLGTGVAAEVAEQMRARVLPAGLEELGEQFGALAEPARLRLVAALCSGERMVGELAEATGISQPSTSRHMAALLSQGIVARRRAGVRTYYRLAPPALHQLRDVLWFLADRA
jgi:GAF domain-containing protein